MQGSFGTAQFATTGYDAYSQPGLAIALLGDTSSHNGTLTTTNQDGTFVVMSGSDYIAVCVNGCEHNCPIIGHGTTAITAVTTRTFQNGKLIITYGAQAGCGAIIEPINRNVYVE